MQSKKHSLLESLTSTVLGFVVSLVLINIVLPWYGFEVQIVQSVGITAIFTVASVLRGYVVRRWFNWWYVSGRGMV